MKLSKHLLLFHLIAFIGYGQDKPLSSYVKSQLVNEEGVVQFVKFDESSDLNFENRSDLLKEILKTSDNTSFVKADYQTDKIGFLHETYQQYFNNIPVEFGIYKTHLKNGIISAINGEYYPMTELNTTPTISADRAFSIALQNATSENYNEFTSSELAYEESNPTLVIFPKMENICALNRLAYKLNVHVEKPLYHADVYVDAQTGEIIFENNKMHNIDVPATGTTLYNGVQNFTAEQLVSGDYRLRQSTSGSGIQTFNATSGLQNATDIISSTTDFTNINDAAVQVHWGTEKAYKYFMQEHGRNSFDNNGALIKSYITPQSANADAYWTGSVLFYSTGNGSTVSPLTSLDVVGHEITHAVIDHSANLIFAYQSGAINESYADIFGEMVENYGQGSNDWLCGATCVQNGFRSMSDPKSKGDPDTYMGQYWQTTSNDNFGVHTNSGVHNKWFYLLAEGGTGINDNGTSYSVNGIGIQKAAEIAYRTLTYYLTPTSKYLGVRNASVHAVYDLYGQGSPEALATIEAWKAVGLFIQQTDYLAPSAPLNLASTNATPYNVTLSWGASTDNVGVLGYSILLNGSSVATTASTIDTVTGIFLQPNINYEFTVKAFDAVGNYSAASNIVLIVFDNIDPTVPTNLSSSNTTQTTTDLSWTASTDNVGVVGYNIYNGASFIQTVYGDTNCTVNNLVPDSTYGFNVRAIDAAGNESGPGNTANVTTLMSSCTGGNGNLTLTITFNDFPWDYTDPNNPSYTVHWHVYDATNTEVDFGENYPGTVYGSTVVENITLPPGLYTFDILDDLGWGNGFVLESNQVMASESNLSLFFPISFCVNSMQNFAPTNAFGNGTQTNVKSSGIIYPNPVLDRLYFKNQANENKTISVVDLTGKIFMEGVLDADNSLDVSKLQSGIYILKMSGSDETENYKFIKQ